jgi:hypothetical protein
MSGYSFGSYPPGYTDMFREQIARMDRTEAESLAMFKRFMGDGTGPAVVTKLPEPLSGVGIKGDDNLLETGIYNGREDGAQ